ncbi:MULTISPECIES: acyl-CoA thioesterase [Falsihalocynthiibacter]|uniref:acyl-CoA thioesterase n=1 Tax=Falsihalocynthiibacter TaxID=2854182 RepID=UPI003003880A
MSKVFTLKRQVEFNHCDPAGIVFYPRYFEMISALVERFFGDAVGTSWAQMLQTGDGMGTPTGSIDMRFRAPSKLGDWLEFSLVVTRIGTSSASFDLKCSSEGETRFEGSTTVVYVDTSTSKSTPWPAPLRTEMSAYLISPTT